MAISSSKDFTRMSSVNTSNNRFRFPLNQRIQSVFEIIRARLNLSENSGNNGNTQRPRTQTKPSKSSDKTPNKQQRQSSKKQQQQPPSTEPYEPRGRSADLCQLCYVPCASAESRDNPGENYMYSLDTCDHAFCLECLRLYLKYQIIESRVLVACPQCHEKMHPNDIYRLLKSQRSGSWPDIAAADREGKFLV